MLDICNGFSFILIRILKIRHALIQMPVNNENAINISDPMNKICYVNFSVNADILTLCKHSNIATGRFKARHK